MKSRCATINSEIFGLCSLCDVVMSWRSKIPKTIIEFKESNKNTPYMFHILKLFSVPEL